MGLQKLAGTLNASHRTGKLLYSLVCL